MKIYADTSFFVSLYLPDDHSAAATRRMAEEPRLWLAPLHRAEWVHAIEQHAFRKELSRREADEVLAEFEQDRADGVWIEAHLPEEAFALCAELARRRVSRLGTRTLDALHVASALLLKAERFWTFDQRQAKLARAEGFLTK